MQWLQNIITTHRQNKKEEGPRIFHWHLWNARGKLSRVMWETAACSEGIIIINKVSKSLNFVIHPLIFIASGLVEWPLEVKEVDVKYSFVTSISSRTADILDMSWALSFELFSIFWDEIGQMCVQVSLSILVSVSGLGAPLLTAGFWVWPEPEPFY